AAEIFSDRRDAGGIRLSAPGRYPVRKHQRTNGNLDSDGHHATGENRPAELERSRRGDWPPETGSFLTAGAARDERDRSPFESTVSTDVPRLSSGREAVVGHHFRSGPADVVAAAWGGGSRLTHRLHEC